MLLFQDSLCPGLAVRSGLQPAVASIKAITGICDTNLPGNNGNNPNLAIYESIKRHMVANGDVYPATISRYMSKMTGRLLNFILRL